MMPTTVPSGPRTGLSIRWLPDRPAALQLGMDNRCALRARLEADGLARNFSAFW
jgi:hypothetical protein